VASYEVRLTHSAEKELQELNKSIIPLVWQKIKGLAKQPRPRQSRKLRGTEKAYRLRVRDYRIIYTINDKQRLVTVVAIRHRKEVYRG
jgi:mRNA interferase RelE/StbE